MKSIRNAINRRYLNYRCRFIAAAQPGRMPVEPGRLVVTTFYDVEGDYAKPGKSKPCFSALEKIANVENDAGIRSTYNVVANFAKEAPQLFKDLESSGHEIASHSLDHRVLTSLSKKERQESIYRARDTFDSLGLDVIGHRSPESRWNFSIVKDLKECGYSWNAENDASITPYVLTGRPESDPVWRFPVTMDDWWYEGHGMAPDKVIENWKQKVEHAQQNGGYMSIGFHPWIEDPGERIDAFREFMTWMAKKPGLTIKPFRDVMAELS